MVDPTRRPLTEIPTALPSRKTREVSPITRFLLTQVTPQSPSSARISATTQLLLDELAPRRPAVAETPVQAPERPSILGEFTTGAVTATQQLVPDIAALGGITAKVFGQDEIATDMMEFAQKRSEEIYAEAPPAVTFEEAFDSPGNVARFALRKLGEQAPIIATTILGGGVGGLIGRLVGRGALTVAEGTVGLSRFGIEVGAVTAASGLETSATAQELFEATGEIKPAAAFIAGIAKGALEAMVPLAFARRLGLGAKAGRDILDRALSFLDKASTVPRRMALGFLSGGIVESTTEFLQEAIDVAMRGFVDDNYDTLGPEARSRMLESATVGGLVGFVLGPLAGLAGGRPSSKETPIDNELPGERPPPPPSTPPAGPVEPELPLDLPSEVPIPPPLTPIPPERVEPPPFQPELPLEVPAEVTPTQSDTITIRTEGDVDTQTIDIPKVQAEELSKAAESQRGASERAMLSVQFANGGGVLNPVVERAGDIFHRMTKDLKHGVVPVRDVLSKIDTVLKSLTSEFGFLKEHETNLANNAEARGIDKEEQRKKVDTALENLAAANRELVALNKPQQLAKDIAVAVAEQRFEGAIDAAQTLRDLITERPDEFLRQVTSIEKEVVAVPETTPPQTPIEQEDVSRQELLDAALERRIPATAVFEYSSFIDSFLEGTKKRLGKGKSEPASRNFTVRRLNKFVRDNPDLAEFREGMNPQMKHNIVEWLQQLYEMPLDEADGEVDTLEVVPDGFDNEAEYRMAQRIEISQNILRGGLIIKTVDPSAVRVLGFKHQNSDSAVAGGLAVSTDVMTGIHYRSAQHEAGTATIVGHPTSESPSPLGNLSHKARTALQNYANAATKMLKMFGFTNERLVIAVDELVAGGDIIRLGENDAGGAMSLSENFSLILVSRGTLEVGNPLKLASNLAHEFGHLLVAKRFTSAPVGVQLKLLRAFDRRLAKARAGKLQDYVTQMRAPDGIELFLHMSDPAFPSTGVAELSEDPEYFFSFSEFLAEQVARWFTTKRKPLTTLEKFFKKLSQELSRVYASIAKYYNLDRKLFRADKDVAAWIDSLVGGKSIGAPEALKAGIEGKLAKSLEANARYTEAPTPDGAMQVRLEKTIDTFIHSKKEAKKIKASVGRINWLIEWGYSLQQLARLNPKVVGLQQYKELLDAWRRLSIWWKARANRTIKVWRRLSKQSQDNLSKFIFDVGAMSYLTEEEDARLPSEAELLSLAKKHRLTVEAFDVYERIKEDFTDFLNEVQSIAERDIRNTIENELIQMVRIAELNKEFDQLRSRPYFPHSRFGDFSVVVKEKGKQKKGKQTWKTVYFEQFEGTTPIDAKRRATEAAQSLMEQYPEDEGFSVRVDKIPKEVKPFRGLPPALLQQLKKMPGLTKQQRVWIDQLSAELSPTKSFRKRLVRRKDIPGYSLDAMRSYANYFWHGSNYLARLRFQGPLQKAINDVHNEASDPERSAGMDVTKLRRIGDFMQNHFDQVLHPGPDWAQMRSIAFIWWLGFVPQSAFVNLTQVPMVAWPYLAARYGDVKAVAALKRGYGTIWRVYRMKTDNISDSYLKARDRAVKNDVVSESFAAELAATAEGSNLSALLPGTKAQRALMQSAHWAAFLFQTSEKTNREVTFSAAWDLAMKDPDNSVLQELKAVNQLEFKELLADGFSEQEALAYIAARSAVHETMFQYSSHARPRFIRGRKGVVFTFYTFLQGMVNFAAHDRGRTRFYLMMFFLAGMMGLPGAEDAAALAKYMAREIFGAEFDIEKETRSFVVGLAGDSIDPDLILHGVSREGFGISAAADLLGIPLPAFDLSASLSMGRVIPGLTEFASPGADFNTRFSRVSTDVAGATLGIGINMMQAMTDDELPFDDWKRWERAMPRSIKNLVRANRYLNEGRERTRADATVLEFDVTDPKQLWEIVMQAAGFTPTRLSRTWDRQRMRNEAVTFWTGRRRMLMKQFDHAVAMKDPEAIRDVTAAIKRYNNEVAIPGFGITTRELRQSRRERSRRRRLFEAGLPVQKRATALVRDVDKLFPEVEDVEDASRMR